MDYRLLRPEEMPLLTPLMRALSDYHNAIAETFAGIFPVRPREDQTRELGEQIAVDKGRVEITLENNEPIAFCAGTFEKNYGTIDFLYVREAMRGKGIGGRLLTGQLDYFREKGVTFVDLGVVRGNPAAEFYERHGFEFRSRIFSRKLG